ncbi:hypothetical protein TREMEDRAFT_74265 [Tremella mesenterica DSM 1558]|uniref:uncharacterized protein n=1 Tax=Tremella mesenterica (strain ATCC 24925 / CBS 8224 / DSM 1558 / NBRC 9311 / NRRL Y-6157 / RJB 2259-6 / UBC 559-6) TaxID=578456 RepID=UPI0003F49AF0|nr:uncharacterized protein TREMEDRAFT_74265 [Tremella mesenterica DSM 1558]EIW68385.1 hypothetical protein TREMEDRAFT_74265 [Tremella mesenterica DSM 1558]
MSLRGASGKFSLPSFGRKNTGTEPTSPSREYGNDSDFSPASPTRENGHSAGGGGGGGGLVGMDNFGRSLGKKIAHQSLLPALGNKDQRALQDIIALEKGVLSMTEKLAIDTQKAAAALPVYGAQEGADLQDVLGHSATLLSRLSTALTVFTQHQASLRGCLKRIREREEALADLKRRRRDTGNKAENAEKKLAKMGPENKGLPQQTELLERLRQEMRQLDTEIVTEESKLGDFKRQIVKEALSFKFGGLEELGEKMCIIGELGKLLLEEIPLEETPPGYGRAPYNGFDNTSNAVNEANKCLATVEFHASNASPKPPGLPQPVSMLPLTAPNLPRLSGDRISAAEEFAHYPGNAVSPESKPTSRDYMNASYPNPSDPYNSDPSQSQSNIYDEFGGMRPPPTGILNAGGSGSGAHVVWQGPTEEALNVNEHDYERVQQREMDQEAAAWQSVSEGVTTTEVPEIQVPIENEEVPTSPWEPLNVKRDHSVTPTPDPLNPLATLGTPINPNSIPTGNGVGVGVKDDLLPPPNMAQLTTRIPTPATGEFYTPSEGPDPLNEIRTTVPRPSSPALSIPPPQPGGGGGKISAAAFRRPRPLPRNSEGEELPSPGGIRRLPVPPSGGFTSGNSGPNQMNPTPNEGREEDAFPTAEAIPSPPPTYGEENLR